MFFVTLSKNRHRREGGAEKTGQLSRNLSAERKEKIEGEKQGNSRERAGKEQGKSRKSPKKQDQKSEPRG